MALLPIHLSLALYSLVFYIPDTEAAASIPFVPSYFVIIRPKKSFISSSLVKLSRTPKVRMVANMV